MQDCDAFAQEFDVSRETLDKFHIYHEKLKQWAPRINLISLSTIDEIWIRHFANSARILPFLNSSRSLIDFGTGAGFPGLVLATLLSQTFGDDIRITLVDENYKRAAFLRETARAMGVKVLVLNNRVEDVEPLEYDIVTARAFAPLERLLPYSEGYAQLGARLLFLKGKDVKNEIEIAKRKWNFDFDIKDLDQDSGSCILSISNLERSGNEQ